MYKSRGCMHIYQDIRGYATMGRYFKRNPQTWVPFSAKVSLLFFPKYPKYFECSPYANTRQLWEMCLYFEKIPKNTFFLPKWPLKTSSHSRLEWHTLSKPNLKTLPPARGTNTSRLNDKISFADHFFFLNLFVWRFMYNRGEGMSWNLHPRNKGVAVFLFWWWANLGTLPPKKMTGPTDPFRSLF